MRRQRSAPGTPGVFFDIGSCNVKCRMFIIYIYYVQYIFTSYIYIYIHVYIHTTDYTVLDVEKNAVLFLKFAPSLFFLNSTICCLEAYWHYECEEPKGKSKSTKAKAKACDNQTRGDFIGLS